MDVSREEIVGAFVQALGKEAAESLISKKIDEAGLPYKSKYDMKELEKIVEALKKEGTLVRTLAMAFISQVRLRGLQSK
jgi:hypothetical protein